MTSSSKMLVSTLYGHQLLVNPDDEFGGIIIRKGIYNKPYVYLLNKILKNIKQAIVFDIGANIGNHAISISQHCESIYAFEPDSETNIIEKTRRFIHKISKQEKWTLTPADLSKKHANIFLVHPDKLNLISHMVISLIDSPIKTNQPDQYIAWPQSLVKISPSQRSQTGTDHFRHLQ